MKLLLFLILHCFFTSHLIGSSGDTLFYYKSVEREISVIGNKETFIIYSNILNATKSTDRYVYYFSDRKLDSIYANNFNSFVFLRLNASGSLRSISNNYDNEILGKVISNYDRCITLECQREYATQFSQGSSLLVFSNCCNKQITSISEIIKRETVNEERIKHGIEVNLLDNKVRVVQLYSNGNLSGLKLFIGYRGKLKMLAIADGNEIHHVRLWKDLFRK